MSDSPVDQAAIEKVLAEFKDPESGRDVVSMGQMGDIRATGDTLSLTLGLTTFSAPLWQETKESLETLLRERFPRLSSVDVKLAVHERKPEPLGQIGLPVKAVIAVGSGKGGVGKSTIATLLALGLQKAGAKVGLVDADVYGPSIPQLLGLSGRPEVKENRIQPIVKAGLPVMSMGFLVPAEEAVIWRGPMLHGAITQFLRDTEWGELDYLIIDMPPGTGDIALTLSQLLPLRGAVVVCTPQDVALLDAVKAITMFGKVNIPVLGMVENMSGFHCPDCNKRHDIFGSGGARRKAEKMNLPFLGEVPINIAMRENGDAGTMTEVLENEATGPIVEQLCCRLLRNLATESEQEPPLPTLSVL